MATNLSGVDLVDQALAMYPHRRRKRHWYLHVFFHFLDLMIVNACHLYKIDHGILPLLNFKAAVAHTLINLGQIEKQSQKQKQPSSIPPQFKRGGQWQRRQRKCGTTQGATDQNWPISRTQISAMAQGARGTQYICTKWNGLLCSDCFESFYTR